MSGSRCDADGNLYIRKYATDRPMLSPVVKIDADGKRTALFDPVSFSQLKLNRADAFAPAADGGLYQMASTDGAKPRVYVLHFFPDGSSSSPILLESEIEPYQFAPFPGGNLLVSGFQSDPQKGGDERPLTAVFSGGGRRLADISFEAPPESPGLAAKALTTAAGKPAAQPVRPAVPSLPLSDAEAGADGNIYAMRVRRSSLALVDVISPAGKILRTLKIRAPVPDAKADASATQVSAFHVSNNQLAVEFEGDSETQMFVVADTESGRPIATYSYAGEAGASFACYSADEGVFTFVNLAEGNSIEVIRATAQ